MPRPLMDPTADKVFYKSEFDLPLGPYKIGDYIFGPYNLGKVDFQIGPTGTSFSYTKQTDDVICTTINKNLSELGEEFISHDLKRTFESALQKINIDLSQVLIKEIALEGPGSSAHISMSKKAVGAGVGAQLGAIRLTIVTPFEELVVRLKRGAGLGLEFNNLLGKPQKVTAGMWEFEYHKLEPQETPPLDAVSSQTQANKQSLTLFKQQKDVPVKSIKSSLISKNVAKAEKFVEKSKGTVLNQKEQEQGLLDATVETITGNIQNTVAALALQKHYQQYADKAQGFIEVQKKIQTEDNPEQLNQIVQGGISAGIFLTSVAQLTNSPDLARFAVGVKAATMGFTGLSELSSSCQLIGAGQFSFSTGVGLLNGASMVLQGISLLGSLMGEDDNELGEALSKIHSAVMGMWYETRVNFKETWDRIDNLKATLLFKEELDKKRFQHTVHAIEKTREDILVSLTLSHHCILDEQKTIESHVVEIKHSLQATLKLLFDLPTKEVLLEMEKSEAREIQKKVMTYSNRLRLWLTDIASSRAGSELWEGIMAGPSQAIRILEELNFSHRNTSDLKLAVYVRLAESINPGQFSEGNNLIIINPQHWRLVLNQYINLMGIAKFEVSRKSEAIRCAYLNEMFSLKQITEDISSIFNSIAYSTTLWTKLLENYQASFKPIAPLFRKIQDPESPPNNKLLLAELELILLNIQYYYLQLISFIRLVDSNYQPLPIPLITNATKQYFEMTCLQRQFEQETKLHSIEAAESLELFIKRIESAWKEPLEGYTKTESVVSTVEALKAQMQSSLPEIPVLIEMKKCQNDIEKLIHLFQADKSGLIEDFAVAKQKNIQRKAALTSLFAASQVITLFSRTEQEAMVKQLQNEMVQLEQEQQLFHQELYTSAQALFFRGAAQQTPVVKQNNFLITKT